MRLQPFSRGIKMQTAKSSQTNINFYIRNATASQRKIISSKLGTIFHEFSSLTENKTIPCYYLLLPATSIEEILL